MSEGWPGGNGGGGAAAFSAADLAARVGGEVQGLGSVEITHIDALETAGPGAVTFIRSQKFAPLWGKCQASAALVTRNVRVAEHDAKARALIVVPDADAALFKVLELFAPARVEAAAGRHALAAVDGTARVDESAAVGPHCVVCAGAEVGAGAVLHAGVYVGAGARVGAGTVLWPGVCIMERCVVGERCMLGPGVVIGGEGFGYMQRGRQLAHVPHIGDVVLGDHVEIGANTCIDRAKFGSTVVGSHTKIDNLVQIGHNCRIGKSCLICGNCGLSGSVVLGDGVTLGGGVGVADNIVIGAGARVAGGAGVMNNIPAGETWMGYPAGPAREQARNYALLRKLAVYLRKLRVNDEHGAE